MLAVKFRGPADPLLQVVLEREPLDAVGAQPDPQVPAAGTDGERLHVDDGAPLLVGFQPQAPGEAALVVAGRLVGGDDGLAPEVAPPVAQAQPVRLGLGVQLALLVQDLVLDLEEVGEVGPGVHPDLQVDRLLVVVEDGQRLPEAAAHRPFPDHRQLRVDVVRGHAGHQEEPGLVVLQVVVGQDVEPLAVDGEHPLRQVARVEREETRRLVRGGLDVAAVLADHERVAVQDADGVLPGHQAPLPPNV